MSTNCIARALVTLYVNSFPLNPPSVPKRHVRVVSGSHFREEQTGIEEGICPVT